MRPGQPGWAFATSLLGHHPQTAELRAEGLTLLRRTEAALAEWLDRAPGGGPRHGGAAAARTLVEGVIWTLVALPSDPDGWSAEAPAAFAALAARWRALHLEA